MLKTFLETLKSKFYIPLALAILCGGALMAEKAINPSLFMTSDMTFLEKTYLMKSDKPLPTHLDFRQAMFNYTSMFHLLMENEETEEIDFPKLVRTWETMPLNKKAQWFSDRIGFIKVADNIVVITLYIDKKDEGDSKYIKENAERILDKIAKHSEKQMNKYDVSVTFDEVDNLILLPKETQAPSTKRTLAKYGLAGGALGFVLGVFIVAVIGYRRARHE